MKKEIIIIEDEPLLLDLMVEELVHSGFKAHGVSSGQAFFDFIGLQEVKSIEDFVILTDQGLPGLKGIEIIEKLKMDFPNKSVQSILLSGVASDQIFKRAMDSGVFKVLEKPVKMPNLCTFLKELGA